MYSTFATPYSWDPLTELRRIQQTMNRMFDGNSQSRCSATPPVNLYANDNGVLVTAEIPGLDCEAIDVTVHGGSLRIEGRYSESEENTADGWQSPERGRGQFSRSIDLPFRADPDSVEANFVNGILEIELTRPEDDKPRRIRVNA